MNVHDNTRCIAFIYLSCFESWEGGIPVLICAMGLARKRTSLPVCLYADTPVASMCGDLADILVAPKSPLGYQEARIAMSRWVPTEQWLYLDHDALVVGNDISFGFRMLDKGFDCALCTIQCEADKMSAACSSQFARIRALDPDFPRYAFYPQLGVSFQQRSDAWVSFEKNWLDAKEKLRDHTSKVQPSFAYAYDVSGSKLSLYVLPPHFNCRKNYVESQAGRRLGPSPVPRQNVQVIHDRNWFNESLNV